MRTVLFLATSGCSRGSKLPAPALRIIDLAVTRQYFTNSSISHALQGQQRVQSLEASIR